MALMVNWINSFRLQDDANERNFIVSGVLIYAAARIYGRKVDYLEQEILGIRKNFEAVDTNEEKQPEKELKKSRSKKFVIKDSVSVEKQCFEEKPIQVLTKIDINKTIAKPSRIDRLERMKDVFLKKSQSGKRVIPKSLQFSNDDVISNFGSSQIYEFDDNKEVVGSRRDFACFSYFINSGTGELQSDFTSTESPEKADINISIANRENIPVRAESPEIWGTPPTSPLRLISTSRPPTPTLQEPEEFLDAIQDISTKELAASHAASPLSINIDEGIEIDEATKANMLLTPITGKLVEGIRSSPNHFSNDNQQDKQELTNNISDGGLLSLLLEDTQPTMRNILMIPLKKLKHKCIFDLPNSEYGELKRRKKEQFKQTSAVDLMRQSRIFKPLQMSETETLNDDDEPFLGFTEEQQEPSTVLNLKIAMKLPTNLLKASEMTRKFSNDSGWLSGNDLGDNTAISSELTRDLNSSQETSLRDSSNQLLDYLAEPVESSLEETVRTNTDDSSINISSGEADTTKINTSSGDSCYHSCVSADSTKTELSSFFKDIESRNETIVESTEPAGTERDSEAEERVLEMQKGQVNVSYWNHSIQNRF